MPNLRNALSDYGQWSQAHPWKSAAIGFVPVVGQAQGVADTAEALNRKAYGEAGFNALMTVFPFGRAAKALKGRAGIVAGEKAATANQEALGKAKELMRSGADRATIHAQTGWWQGPDRKWRFEIDDSAAKISDRPLPTHNVTIGGEDLGWHEGWKVGDVLEHNELYKAYPELKGVESSFMQGNGAKYQPIGEGWISYGEGYKRPIHTPEQQAAIDAAFKRADEAASRNSPDFDALADEAMALQSQGVGNRLHDTSGVTLHELQHAIQETEGFAKGGNPQQFIAEYNRVLRDYNDQIDAINEQLKRAVGTPRYDELLQERSYLVKEIQKIEGAHGFGAQEKGHDTYRRLAGEAEARAVQARRNFPAGLRAQRPFWEDFDVPESEQIIR